ncbi:prohead protease/major capsid protein fusion protein [Azospirillum argentinense]
MTTPPNGAAPGGAVTERTLPPGVALGWRANGDTSVRAASLEPTTFNADARTVELIASTGATVRRFDWWREEYYDEVLTVSAEAVDLTRFEAGSVSILNTHSQWDVKSVLGTGVPGTARFEDGNLILTAKLSARDDVAPTVQDIKDGILRNVSVGYRILAYEVDETTKPQTRKITRWELLEVSFVPVGADGLAGTRSFPPGPAGAPQAAPAPVTVNVNIPDFTRAPAAQPTPDNTKENRMSDTPETPAVTQDPPVVENRGQPQVPPAQTQAVPPALAPQPESDPLAAMRAAEVDRIAHIQSRAACTQLGLPSDMIGRAITEGWSLDAFNRAVIDHVAAQPSNQRNINPHVQVIADEGDAFRQGAVGAILSRLNPGRHKAEGPALEWRNISPMSLAEEALRMNGINPRRLRNSEIAARALSTSDYPHIMGEVSRAILRDAYDEVPRTWLPLSLAMLAMDFKEMKEIRLSGGGVLPKVKETGEYTYGKLYESAETIKVETYGEVINVSRQMIVNDRLDALAAMPRFFGRRAAQTENEIMWNLLISNPVMGDGKALFHASHKNLASSGTKLSVAGLGTGRAAMRLQTDLDGKTPINVAPKFLVVPAALETVAEQIIASRIVVTSNADIVPDTLRSLTPISEGRLDANSTTAWYLIAAPTDAAGCLRHAYLEGEESVYLEEDFSFDVDGMKMKARHDFGGAAMDFRGVYKDPGAAPSP